MLGRPVRKSATAHLNLTLKHQHRIELMLQCQDFAMNIYDPVFSSSKTAMAAGMSHSNFRAHRSRGNWMVGGKTSGVKAESHGKGHLFSIYDVLGYALAHRLIRFGVDPALAFNLAMFNFAHVGVDGREPGGVFDVAEHGYTLFVYSPGADRAQCMGTKSIGDPIELLFPPGYQRASDARIISLNDLRAGVFAALGLDARDYE